MENSRLNMKKPTNLRIVFLALFLLQSIIVVSQNLKPFTPRFDRRLKGDMLLIGNNILNRSTNNRTPNDAFNISGYNSDYDMRYIDVDNDNTTFSSSSATLTVPKPACYKILYAGLYWGAILQQNDRSNIEKVKLKLPTGGYHDINGQIIHDANNAPIGGDNNKAYACYADITALVAGQTDAQGVYTVANVRSSQGLNGGTGLSAGWSIYVVYEDPTLTAKYITSFDGFSGIGGATTLDIPVSGFKTIPTGPVRVKFAFAALEGDEPITGDYLQINGITINATNAAGNIIRPNNNFFNSSVTYVNPATDKTENFLNRNPASTNTLGYDAGILNINNPGTLLKPGGIVIDNNATSANIRLGSTQDVYFYYFNAFAVDIIEPNIVLTKIVKNAAGQDIGNQDVVLGQELNYEIGFKNTGNDDARGLTIRDQLPINIIFNYPADLNPLPAGVTVQSYNPTTRSIVFAVDNSLVKANTLSEKIISFKVKVVPDCNSLSEACSNSIDNSAYATYRGTLNTDFQISDDPSVNTNTGCILTPKATNFLVGVDGCKYTANVILCKESVDLVAANGYTSYTWYSDEARTRQIGTGQTLNVRNPGTYYVYNLAAAPCRSIYQAITVTRFGATNTNPVIPYAQAPYKGEVLICPNDGKQLPNLFLCGANDARLIETHISDGSTIVWERLVEGSCPAPSSANCANESDSCSWTQVGTGPNYNATTAGQYRLTLNYAGGCFSRFYFNVFTNVLNPTETHKDLICGKPGSITIGGVPAGYQYSIDGTNYQASNTFNVTTAGFYTVYIKQTGVTVNPCIFTVPNIQIRQRNFSVVTEVTEPLCYGEKGRIRVAVNDANPQYYYKLTNNGNVLYNIGPIADSEYVFDNLNTNQNYVIEVSTDDGCKDTQYKYIGQVWNEYKATAALVEPLTACSDGKIRITVEGGSTPYSYFINSDTDFQTSNEYTVTAPGTYEIKIVDRNNCTITRTIVVANNAKPTYTITNTNSVCYNDNSEIRVNVTNANGYSMSYSINNGGTFQTSPVFSNLQPGTYNVVVRYGISYTPQYGQPTMKYCSDPAVQRIIAGPTSAVTASGGVAELAGCTLSQQGGKLRINNAQGGTTPYQYSFDGGVTWQNTNEKDVLPGSYNLKIRDAVGCEYTIPYTVTLDQKPAEPTINVEDPIFNCNGTATSTVTITNGTSANYSYEYYLNGVPNTPISNNVFLNVPSGTHTVSVKYNVTTVSTYSNLLQEDFGRGGYTTTPGINPAYCFEDESTPHYPGYPCGAFNDYQINDGKYAVASSIKTDFGGTWIVAKDHTLPQHPLGRFLCVNVGGSAGIGGILYSKPIKDVIDNQSVIISLWAENLMRAVNSGHDDPKLTIQLVNNLNNVGGTEEIVATTDTTNPWVVPKSEKWEYRELTLNPGSGKTNLSFVIRSYSNEFNGNDVLIDDIWVRQIPKSCLATKDFPVTIGTDKAFTASITGFKDLTCFGANNGEITISAENFKLPYGFDYSLDNGVTWVNSKVSPVTATGLASRNYNIQVRYDASASPCIQPLTHEVKGPSALTITATVTKVATCTEGATITAVASGGTPAFEYELRAANGVTVIRAFQNTGVFANVPSGVYTVVTRDQNACSSSASAQVTVNAPVLLAASLANSSDLCYDTNNQATLVVTANGTAPYTYSLNGAPAQNSNTFTNVAPGTYNIVVTDANNCTVTISNIVIAPALQGSATISKTLDCTSASPDATITVDITGGTAPFTYKVKKGAGTYGASVNVTGTSFVYSATTADSYDFEITDSRGCVTVVNAVINPIVNPTVTATKVDATCNGAATGSVQLTGAGGSGTYTYLLYNSTVTPVPTNFIAQSNYTGLAAGTYSYQVKDSKGCTSAVGSITLTQPTTLTATATATTFTCDASNVKQAATVTIAVPTTGTAPYQYSFDGGVTFSSTRTFTVIDNGTNQTISYVVSDAQGCKTGVQTIIINRLNPPTDITFTANAVTCTATTTSVTALATNGVGTITYSITSPAASVATNTTGVFAGLAPGTYNFRATDANGCYFDKPYTINAVSPISIVANKDNDVLCKGGSTGKVTFTVSGHATVGAYTQTLTAGSGTLVKSGDILTLSNVPAGSYTVQVRDNATGCTNSVTVVVNEPANPLTFTTTATKINCNNDLADITITPAGGTPNYTYAVVVSGATAPTTYASGNVVSVDTNSGANLVWDVYTKDANGCITTNQVTIQVNDLPTVTVTNGNQCGGTGSTFVLTATGTGTAPLTYSIDGTSFQTSNVFNVPAGTYTVTVKDANGCTATATTPLVIYPQLVALASVTKELDCTTTPNATITVAVSGGRAPFTYTVAKGTGAASAPSAPFSSASFTYTVTSGNVDDYTFVVTDANGCISTTTTTVNPIANPTVTATHVNPTCDGGNNGSVELTGAGGSGGYTYSINGTTYTASAVFTGLAAGTHTFYVKDSKGCVGTVDVILVAPTQLAATVTTVPFSCDAANGKVAGTVTVNVTAGTGTTPYEYSFNGGGFGASNVLTLNDNGADQPYTYSVRDAQGCTISGSGTLLRLNPPTDITFNANAVTCTATTTTVTALAVNGVGTITYSITSPAASVATNTTGVFAGLAPGTYNFRATDANGCYFDKPYTINAVTPITIVANKDSDVLCKGGATGRATFTISGHATVGAYTHTLTAGTGTLVKAGDVLTLSNVVAGTYTVEVRDNATGCINTATVVIDEPANPLTFTTTATKINCNNDLAEITITPAGGTPNYTYAVVVSGATAPTTYASGNVVSVDTNSGANLVWDVYTKDANGCITTNQVTIQVNDLPTVTVTNGNQCSGTGSTFVLTATGTGTAPLTYSIDGTSFQTSNVFNVPAGTYTVTVKDAFGCTATATTPLVIYPQLVALASVTKELDCTITPNATITVAVSGGRAPFTYTVAKGTGAASTPSAPFSSASFTYTVTAGNVDDYTFVVTDANGCSSTTITTVNPITNPTVTEIHVDPSCNGGNNGSVELTGAGGSGGYTYSIDGTTYTASAVFTGLAAGTYTFYVKDSKGCIGTIDVPLVAPTQLVATVTEVPFACNTANGKVAGTVTVNVTAGTGTTPYTYSFNGGGFGASNVLTLNDNGADQPYTYSVRDAQGCIISGSGTLLRLNPPTDLTFAANAVTCTATTTTVTVTAVNGVGTLQYETIAPSPVIIPKQTSNAFANLAPGTYMFKVTDANGCFYTEAHTINPVTPITLVGAKISDALCNAGSTGSARFTVGGYATTYSYTVNGGTAVTGQTASVFNLVNLAAGNYTVIVTDEGTGCTETASVLINEPAVLAATYTAINGNCSIATSSVTVNVTGGTPVYRYSFVQNNALVGTYTNSNTANLDPTVNTEWDVHIIDASGCTFKLDITIANDVVPTVTASATGQCFGVGSYTITATPGTGVVAPITYSINNGASYQTGNTFVITTPGSYTVRIKDGNGCTADSNVIIVNNALSLSAVLDKDITCSAPTAAQITLTTTGGNGPFTYTSTPATGTFAGNVFTTSTPDSYIFTVVDANGCTVSTTTPIVVSPTVTPVITNVSSTDIQCFGDSNGTITITIDNTQGVAPFVYNIFNNTTGVDYKTQTSGLPAGDYTVTVTDSKGCFTTADIEVKQPSQIVVAHHAVPITCTSGGISKGSVIVDSVTGGVGPYNYFVTGVNGYDASELNNLGTTSVSFNVVDFGLYQINVVDANGCSVLIKNVLVASPPEDLDITVTPPPADCSAPGSAVVAIGAASTGITGPGPFHFAIYTGPGMVYTAPTALPWYDEDGNGSKKTTIPNLIPGVTYTFIVHDAGTGCYYFESAQLPIPTNSTLTTNALIADNVTCKGSADGNVTFTIASTYGTPTPVSYEIFNSQSVISTGITGTGTVPANGILTVSDLGPLPFGNYFVLVRETAGATNAGCSVSTVPFNITESSIDFSVTASVSKNANCAANSGVITAIGHDGTAPYTYQLLLATDAAPTATTAGWASANTFNRNAGNYTVYAKDAYGCIREVDITLDRDADPTITAPATICYTGSAFTIAILGTVDPAVGGATYSVNGSAFQTSPNFTYNASGIYNLTIKDNNGCTATVAYEVKPQLFLSAALTKELDCTATGNAEITLTATGGYDTAYTYEYSTDNGATYTAMASNVLSTSAIGNYTFRVSDAKLPAACQATTTLRLDPVPPAVFTTVQTHVSCFGGNDGTITVNVSSGVGPYQYQLGSGIFQTSNVFAGLTAGTTYVVTVRDAKSCLYPSGSITITQPSALTATSVVTTALTCTTGNAATKAVVTVTAAQGTAPYLYSFDNGATYSATNTYESYVGTTFNVLVKDAKGCTFTLTNGVDIPALNPPTITNISGTPIYCAPTANTTSTVTITTTNGVAALSYAILAPSSATSNVTGASNGIFTGLAVGTYLFEVTDANGCKDQKSYTIDPVTNITVAGQLVSNVICNGGTTGAVRFTAANYAGTYTATLTPASGTVTQTGDTVSVTGLVPGTYTIAITDDITGCTATTSVDVTQPTPVVLSLISNKNAYCNFGAQVTVMATGGTPGYTYAWGVDGFTPVAGDYDTSNTAVLDPTVDTDWDFYAMDANGCVTKLDVTIATDAPPSINPPATPYCYTGGPVAIRITGTYVGTPMFSIGNGYQSSPDFVLNAPGSYTFYIKDGNGCIVSAPYILRQELLLKATLTQDYTCAGDASITLLATQGTLTYSNFEVSFNGGAYAAITTPLPYTTNVPGTYTFRVTDSQGCQATSVSVEVTPTTTPTATFTTNDVSCTGGSDGSIVFTASNGVAPYRYSIDNGVTFVSSNIFIGLAAGTYDVVIQDAKQCVSLSFPVTIGQPSALAATAVLTQALTCGTGNTPQPATVTINVTAGTGTAPYQYSFNGGTTYGPGNTYTTTTSGTVTAYVKDANNCVIATPVDVVIPALNPPTITNISGTPIYCAPIANTTSTVTITTTNGVGSLNYVILSPASATSNVTGATNGIFTGLAVGNYLFEVTDANGCKDQESYIVDPVTNITVAGQLVSNVVCNGETNGAVRFTVANYTGTYTATVTPASGTVTQTGDTVNVTGLVPGTYTIAITDDITGCTATTSVDVTQPTLLVLSLVSNKNANCNFGAQVTVKANGGTPGYKYAWGVDGFTPVAGDYDTVESAVLNPATTDWDFYAMDANGCVTKLDVTIASDLPPSINPPALPYCYVGGPVAITITGTYVGTPMFSIGNGYQSSPDFVLNAPGNYTFYIKDGNGCIVSAPYTLRQELLLKATLTQDYTCAGDASITLLATQGTLTYSTFEVSFNGGTYSTITTPLPYTTNVPGTYTFRVTDSQGCQATSVSVEVTPTTTPSATYETSDVTCTGGSDGSIVFTPANGVAPYRYSIDNGVTFVSSNIFTDLAAGTYNVVIQDAKQCVSVSFPVTIAEPTALAATAVLTQGLTCGTGNAAQPAIVTINVTAGTGTAPYQYSFNGGTTYGPTNTYTTTTSGTVTAYVKDANNCVIAAPVDVVIPALNPPTITNVDGTPIYCAPSTSTTSTVTVTTTNGVGGLSFVITSPASAITNTSGATTGVFTLLPAGTYNFKVTDTNGCTDEATYTVKALVNITNVGQLINDVVCNGESNGSVKFDIDNFDGTYTAVLTAGPTTGTLTQTGKVVTLTNLPVGTYTVQVTDDITGCTASASVIVGQPAPLSLTQTSDDNANCNKGYEVTVSATGGTPNYQYAFVVAPATPTAADYTNSPNAVLDPASGTNWRAYVKDANNCETFIPITIVVDPLPNNITVTLASQCPNTTTHDYTFTVNVGGGIGPFQYSIGNGFQTSNSFTVTASGTYEVTVKDANECEVTVPAAVTILPALQLNYDIVALPNCSITNSGEISATATGGSGNYRYTLNGGVPVNVTPATFTNVTAGTHILRVRDMVTNCIFEVTIEVSLPTEITGLTLAKTDVTCNGGNNGTITASLEPSAPGKNDNPVYLYRLTGTNAQNVPISRPDQTSPLFENVEAGDYTITVTSGRGCVDSEDVRIDEPAVILVPLPVIAQYGCTTGNVSNYATVTAAGVTGGTLAYTYIFFRDGVEVQRGTENVYTESDFLGGNYSVSIIDSHNCTGASVGTIRVNPFIKLDDILTTNVAITCISNEDVTVTVATTGGTPVLLNYRITGTDNAYNQANTNGNFTGLGIGSYLIRVTNPATGCFLEEAYYVNNPNTFEIVAKPIVTEICFGTNDGSVELTFVDNQPVPSDDAGRFEYTITGGALPITGTTTDAGPLLIENLAAGTYTVTAKLVDSPECTVSTVFTIAQPSVALDVIVISSPITCLSTNYDNGEISASAVGGWDNDYEYQLMKDGVLFIDYRADGNFTGLGVGNYTINAKDSKGCPASKTVNLVIPDPIVINAAANATMLSCFGGRDGVITVNGVTGGQGSNYSYTLNYLSANPIISSGPQTSPVFNRLPAGTYSISVTDGYNCAATSTDITITEPAEIIVDLTLASTQTCLTETVLTLGAVGGTAPYTYSADGITYSIVTFTTSTSFPVPVGKYQYYVKDANGCVAVISNEIKIDALEPLGLDLDVTNAVVKCAGEATGVIVANATGALGNYQYTLETSGGVVVLGPQADPRFEGLVAGNYNVRVVSGDCNAVVKPVEIKEPAVGLGTTNVVIDATCFGENNGKIVMSYSGGTGLVKFAISPDLNQFDTKNTFEGLSAGTYTVVTQDENGCYIVDEIEVKQPNPLIAIEVAGSMVPELCKDDKNGAFSIEVTGGTGPYSISLDAERGPFTLGAVGQTKFDFTGLSGGTHIVYIRDAAGCSAELREEMPLPVVLNPKVAITYDCVNNAQSNRVVVTVDETNSTLSLIRYELDGNSISNSGGNVFFDVPAGTHTIAAIHENGCYQFTEEFVIKPYEPLTLMASPEQKEMNIISVVAGGGAPEYLYSFNGEPFTSSNKYKIYKSGDYVVIVRDQNGCEVTITVPGVYVDVCIDNHFTPNGDGINDYWGPGCTNIYNNLKFLIFDRYGRAVAKYTYGQKWDGKYNGEELPSGDYWYVLKLNDEKDNREFVGHFTLYR
ncbi:gliding motility-associated C-terminal domain-containing protein [Flavobacterium hercynium]|uniref:MAM domain-containing protein n=2 Tax=Flavobacterium hercynium TaxID=387094 RepID=A0A226HKU2_9FLAO|nr:hypothetical protein B0A66_03065 [Flavobacterium hercynium]SMP07568.1 gliding motility-associated C-terminal domain-containing protein [Flavobacterium hercynium]